MENTSGMGKGAAVPPEIQRWNWGAFLLSWIWGIANNVFIALLALIPLVNIVMPFVLGAKGSTWAWQNRRWESVEQFRRSQRHWAIGGLIAWILLIAAVVGLFMLVSGLMKSSGAYQAAMARIEHSRQVAAVFGRPLESGMLQGHIEVRGPDGEAHISFPLEGPKAKGRAYVEARKRMGRWHLLALEVAVEGRPRRIILVAPSEPAQPFGPQAPSSNPPQRL